MHKIFFMFVGLAALLGPAGVAAAPIFKTGEFSLEGDVDRIISRRPKSEPAIAELARRLNRRVLQNKRLRPQLYPAGIRFDVKMDETEWPLGVAGLFPQATAVKLEVLVTGTTDVRTFIFPNFPLPTREACAGFLTERLAEFVARVEQLLQKIIDFDPIVVSPAELQAAVQILRDGIAKAQKWDRFQGDDGELAPFRRMLTRLQRRLPRRLTPETHLAVLQDYLMTVQDFEALKAHFRDSLKFGGCAFVLYERSPVAGADGVTQTISQPN